MNIAPIFATPVAKGNMNRKFTEDELQLLLFDVPMHKDNNEMHTHHNHACYPKEEDVVACF